MLIGDIFEILIALPMKSNSRSTDDIELKSFDMGPNVEDSRAFNNRFR